MGNEKAKEKRQYEMGTGENTQFKHGFFLTFGHFSFTLFGSAFADSKARKFIEINASPLSGEFTTRISQKI